MVLGFVPLILLLSFTNSIVDGAGLKVGYYRHTCPEAEGIVSDVVGKAVRANPGVAADLIRMHFHDCFVRAGGFTWAVEGGRRDGRISQASDILGNLPPPSFDVNQLTQLFARKQLSQEDMVTLSGGAHSIGVSHCSSFSANRLYNFSGSGGQGPSMDPRYALQLKAKCPASSSSSSVVVPLDPLTPTKLDVKYYVDLQYKRGLLKSD